jgi:hypothetical protein
MHHPTAPVCAVCGHTGRIVEEDTEKASGYIVVCTNRFCEGVPSLCDREATDTKDAAWSYWNWKNQGAYK